MRRSRKITIWMLYVLILGREYVSSQTGTDIKNLYTYLFTTLNYNKDIRPATDQTAATDVSMELLLTGFHGLHEATQQMSSMGILTIKWKDEFLTWTPSSYGGATYIDVPQGKIWKPDLQIQNGMTSFSELGGSFMSLRIFSTGDVSWQPYKVFNTKCLINIAYFPYDRQQCSIKIVAWNSDSTTVNLTKGATPFTLDDELNDGQWAMSDPTANTLVDDGSSLIIYTLDFVRKPKVYIFNIILPMIFLVILDIFTFALPNDSGEKMSYSVAVLLSIFILLTVVSSMLPSSSTTTSYLEVYLLLGLTLGTLILIIVAISLRIQQFSQERQIPQWVRNLTLLSWKFQRRMPKSSIENDESQNTKMEVVSFAEVDKKSEQEPEKKHERGDNIVVLWTDVTSAIDFYMFFMFSIFFIISTGILLGIAGSS